MTNSIKLHCEPKSGVYEYEVRFNPPIDAINFRGKYLSQHKELIGVARVFDGVILHLPKKLDDAVTRLVAKNEADNSDVNIEIIFKRQKRLSECIQMYNVLFERIFKILNFLRVGRKSFNPNAPLMVPQHKLEIWPGYVKSVEEQEGGLMLTLDVSHRVLSCRTVLEVMADAYRSDKDSYQDNIKKALIGKIPSNWLKFLTHHEFSS